MNETRKFSGSGRYESQHALSKDIEVVKSGIRNPGRARISFLCDKQCMLVPGIQLCQSRSVFLSNRNSRQIEQMKFI
jgi:hypothetical protein